MCGYLTFDKPPGTFTICDICHWEDDDVQLRFPESAGANEPLWIYQQKFLQSWTNEKAAEAEKHGITRCPDWRPITRADIDAAGKGPSTGLDYFNAIDSAPARDYWRP